MAARNIAILTSLDIFVLGFIGKFVTIREMYQNAVTKFALPCSRRHLGTISAPTTISHLSMKSATLVILTTDLLLLDLNLVPVSGLQFHFVPFSFPESWPHPTDSDAIYTSMGMTATLLSFLRVFPFNTPLPIVK